MAKKKLPNIHKQAFMYKNTKRFQHDGGRAWIKDSQLHEARKNGNGKLETVHSEKNLADVRESGETTASN